MDYIHVKNIEKYHPGYKDRNLSWCKAYFTMLNSDPEFEMLEEIDKWRLMAFIMLELQLKKPIPINEGYLVRKGFNPKKRAISMSIKMLHNFIVVVTEDEKLCVVDKEKEEDKEEDKEKKPVTVFPFKEVWNNYPNKEGTEDAEKAFHKSVNTDQDFKDIKQALENYKKCEKVQKGFIQGGSRWFRNWRDWIVPPKKEKDEFDKKWEKKP